VRGAVAAIYRHLSDVIQTEISQRRREARPLALAAAREWGIDELPRVSCREPDPWWDIVDALMDRVLWDRDWEDDFVRPDDHPDLAEHMRRTMNISDDYYAAVAPDPNPAQLRAIRARLEELCGGA
jgi:hypothetical protein